MSCAALVTTIATEPAPVSGELAERCGAWPEQGGRAAPGCSVAQQQRSPAESQASKQQNQSHQSTSLVAPPANSKNDFPFLFCSSLPQPLSERLFSRSSHRQDAAARSRGDSHPHHLTRLLKCSVSNRRTSGQGQNKDRPSPTRENSSLSAFHGGRSWICPLGHQFVCTAPRGVCKALWEAQVLLLSELSPPLRVTQKHIYQIQERSCITSSPKGIFIFHLYYDNWSDTAQDGDFLVYFSNATQLTETATPAAALSKMKPGCPGGQLRRKTEKVQRGDLHGIRAKQCKKGCPWELSRICILDTQKTSSISAFTHTQL